MTIAKTSSSLLLAVLILAACGAVGDVPALDCEQAAECGDEGWALCAAGACHVFDDRTGYASATVNLSFSRERMAYSGYVHFLLSTMPDGSLLTCADVLEGRADVVGPWVNPLLVNPETGIRGKYLVFNWTGGTFFPNNLVQFIRPGVSVLAVAMGYSQANGQGVLTSIGCTEKVQDAPLALTAGENISLTINLTEPAF